MPSDLFLISSDRKPGQPVAYWPKLSDVLLSRAGLRRRCCHCSCQFEQAPSRGCFSVSVWPDWLPPCGGPPLNSRSR
jgi:hypothetical protein